MTLHLALSVTALIVLTPGCSCQDSGWPAWPTWPEWNSSPWPAWPAWPAWTPSVPSSAPAPAQGSTELEEAAMISPVSTATNGQSTFNTIAEALSSREDLSLYLQSIALAGLESDFNDEAYTATLFVPNNQAILEAFAGFGYDSLADVRTEADNFGAVVRYHVSPGQALMSSMLQDEMLLSTAINDVFKFAVDFYANGVIVDAIGSSAYVIETDIMAGNSVIHIVDTVLFPFDLAVHLQWANAYNSLGPEQLQSISQVVSNMPALSTFTLATNVAEIGPLAEVLNFVGTVFVPTNAAFEDLAEVLGLNSLEELTTDMGLLQTILLYHVVPERLPSVELQDGQQLDTLEGTGLTVDASEFSTIKGVGSEAQVIHFDLMAGEVVIYIVDGVLLPFQVTEDMKEKIREASGAL